MKCKMFFRSKFDWMRWSFMWSAKCCFVVNLIECGDHFCEVWNDCNILNDVELLKIFLIFQSCVNLDCIVWNVKYWPMFKRDEDSTAVRGGHNYAAMAEVIVRMSYPWRTIKVVGRFGTWTVEIHTGMRFRNTQWRTNKYIIYYVTCSK